MTPEQRARQIVEVEERNAKNDDPGDIRLYALRLVRWSTAKEILGEHPFRAGESKR